jgi:hypothetical protein
MKKLIFALYLSLAGCVSVDGPPYSKELISVSVEKAKLIVYRTWSGTGAVHTAPFFVDEKLVAELHNNTFSIVEVEPGNRIVSYGSMKDPLFRKVKIEMVAGGSYCIELQRGFPDKFRPVPCGLAEGLLSGSEFKYFPLTKKL